MPGPAPGGCGGYLSPLPAGAVVAASEANDVVEEYMSIALVSTALIGTTVFGTAEVGLGITGAVCSGAVTEGIPVPEPYILPEGT